jgi:phage-related protein
VVKRYLEGTNRRSDVDHLGDGLFELRTRVGSNHYRVIFFLWGDHCVALTAFYKNQQQTPSRLIQRAQDRRRSWLATFGRLPPA